MKFRAFDKKHLWLVKNPLLTHCPVPGVFLSGGKVFHFSVRAVVYFAAALFRGCEVFAGDAFDDLSPNRAARGIAIRATA